MQRIRLTGGPHDGREILSHWPHGILTVPVAHPPKRLATDDDELDLRTLRYVDPDLNPSFVQHDYDLRDGSYIGQHGEG